MIMIENIPEDLLQDLNEFSTWFFAQNHSSLEFAGKNLDYRDYVSAEALKQQQNKQLEKFGYPKDARGIDFNSPESEYDFDIFQNKMVEYDMKFRSFLGAKYCALKMFYPEGGFIDWHTNANAFGYNVLLTYSKTGDGAFFYQHPITKEIVELHDKPGWTMKVGMYDKPGGAPLWHCAYTNCERLNWGYVMPDNGWENLVEELNINIEDMEAVYGPLPKLKFGHTKTI